MYIKGNLRRLHVVFVYTNKHTQSKMFYVKLSPSIPLSLKQFSEINSAHPDFFYCPENFIYPPLHR